MVNKKNIIFITLLVTISLFFIWPEKKYKPYIVSDEYQKQVDNFYLPPMPPDWEWQLRLQ